MSELAAPKSLILKVRLILSNSPGYGSFSMGFPTRHFTEPVKHQSDIPNSKVFLWKVANGRLQNIRDCPTLVKAASIGAFLGHLLL